MMMKEEKMREKNNETSFFFSCYFMHSKMKLNSVQQINEPNMNNVNTFGESLIILC